MYPSPQQRRKLPCPAPVSRNSRILRRTAVVTEANFHQIRPFSGVPPAKYFSVKVFQTALSAHTNFSKSIRTEKVKRY